MAHTAGLGRVAILDTGIGGRRVVRALRELTRIGHPSVAVALVPPQARGSRTAREADEAIEFGSSIEEALSSARADAAWLGSGSAVERASFAEACVRAGARHLGPPAEVLRRLAAPDAALQLAAELGVAAAPPHPDPAGRLVEVVFARDARGHSQALGIADVSLRLGSLAVVAETPCAATGAAEEAAARDLAVSAAAAVGWTGVGALRLLFDPASRQLALQALDAEILGSEVVEAAAGIDLVRTALSLAAGGSVEPTAGAHSHAFAVRLPVNDPEAGPKAESIRVELLRLPSGLGVRSETAADEGDDVPGGTGGVLATVVARGESRVEAAARLEQALADADVLLGGSAGSKAWVAALCARPEVRAGTGNIGLLDRLSASGERLVTPHPDAALVAAAIEAYEAEVDVERARFLAEARRGRPRVGPSSGRTIDLRYAGRRHRLDVRQVSPDTYRVVPHAGAAADVRVERYGRLERRLSWAGRRIRVLVDARGLSFQVQVDGVPHLIARQPEGLVVSPMPAVVVALPVSPGQVVSAGDPVARIESMKVETVVLAPEAGVVAELLAPVNGQVDAGGPLLRIQPLGERAVAGAPLELGPPPGSVPPAPASRYLDALADLRRLLLGFDGDVGEARRLASTWRELASAVAVDDPGTVRAEDQVLSIFADLEWLYTRARPPEGSGGPPLEELWRYLHDPESRGAGLTPGFVSVLRRALAHYGVSIDAAGHDLELALLRIQKAHERVDVHAPIVMALLERRLSAGGTPPGLARPDARELLARLADVGQERAPGLADLAREIRYRAFDQQDFERAAADLYAQAQEDLAHLAASTGPEQATALERLVACPQPMATLLVSRMVEAEAGLRRRLVETLLRRYYRLRPLEPVEVVDDSLACVKSSYEREGQTYRVLACHALAAEFAEAAARVARLARDVLPEGQAVLEFFLWQEGGRQPDDGQVEVLRRALEAAGFSRPILRCSVLLATGGQGLANQSSQQHFALRGGPGGFEEDRRYRDVHYMLFERMLLDRLSKFDLERLPSQEDVYLYHGVAHGNPKDERLFAAAYVRDLTPVRDGAGRAVRLPYLERMFHEALAGMRRFQARRPPHQRLEWNRVLLNLGPPLELTREEIRALVERLMPATEGLGLEMVLWHALVPDPAGGAPVATLLRVIPTGSDGVEIRWEIPKDRPLQPMAEYQQKVVQLRRRGLVHPFELVRMLAPARGTETDLPPGHFQEYDLDGEGKPVPVDRPPGLNTANIVFGVIKSFTPLYPEGMRRVILLGDPGREMGSVAEPECRRILAALDMAEELRAPLEWFEVCAGAKISMTTGTENMDWISHVLRRIIEFTQRGNEINVVVMGITVGAQPYWNAEATMLMHTKGILVMVPGSSMVLTGKQALEYSGSVSAEDNEGIGGYDRIMGPNGQAQYLAGSVAEACRILLRHYDYAYRAPGERFPRRARSADPVDRDVRASPHGPEGGAGFATVGDVFSMEKNPDRKKPFEIRAIMAACVDSDHEPLERWKDLRGGETGVIWDARLGGYATCLIGIQSRPLPRLEFVPADGPDVWSAGTLFPQSSKKIARAINAASDNRPVVVLANLSGFDGSPESMRRLQLEYGAEIGRAVVNFRGPVIFCVVSRYHGGAFVVFAKTLREEMEVVAVQGARASVIGGAPAAAVVFAREVETRTRKDPRVVEAEKAAQGSGAARAHLVEVVAAVRSAKLGEVGEEFDRIHSVERALKVGSLDRILAPEELRPWLVAAVERGMARATEGEKP